MTIPVSPVSNNQTFGAWLTTTNNLADIISQNTVTADSSNGGSITTGNSFVNGHFGAEYLYVANTLSGGNVSSSGVLRLLANVAISNTTSNLVVITANSTQSNVRITSSTITLLPTGNVTIGGNTLVVNTGNVVFSGSNVQFSNSPLSGNITFASNTVYSGSVIIANGSFGSNGAVLYSNGTGMYWEMIPAIIGNSGIIANADGIFVNANNGLVANSLGVFVRANTGIIANADGVFVNTAYIATLDANTSAFSNASSTNTFTVGTASFFVANGNVGIGTNTPGTILDVNGEMTLRATAGEGGELRLLNPDNASVGLLVDVGSTDSGRIYSIRDNSILQIGQLAGSGGIIQLYTAAAERMRIDSSGNVGISNNAPEHKLRVEGDISLSGGIHANGSFGSAGQFLTSNGTSSYWSNQVYPTSGIAVSNGSAWSTSKTSPSGEIVGTTDTQTLTNKTVEKLVLNDGYTEEVFAITDGSTVNLDPNNGSIQTWTLGANRTPGQANWAAGQSITLLVDDGSAHTITWTTLAVVWKTDGGTAPTLQLTGFTVIVLWKVGTTIYGARVGDA
jgi:hypothetical protein